MAENWRKKLYPDYKKKKSKKPKIDSRDVAPEDKYKEMDKEAQKELDKIEAEEAARTPIGGWNPLMIKRDSKVQQGINRDKTKNKDFDQILNPDGNYRKPSLGQLREGVDWKKRANQLLMIGAGGTAIVLEGARKTLQSLLINPYGGI